LPDAIRCVAIPDGCNRRRCARWTGHNRQYRLSGSGRCRSLLTNEVAWKTEEGPRVEALAADEATAAWTTRPPPRR
jgi:hypothetical protein